MSDVFKAILETKNIRLGAQNMSEHNFGAYTGEIAAGMLKEFSVRYVILGHSERRQYQKEPDALIAKKAAAAHAAFAVIARLRQRAAARLLDVADEQSLPTKRVHRLGLIGGVDQVAEMSLGPG